MIEKNLPTKLEKDFTKRVREFCGKNNVTLYFFSRKATTGLERLYEFVYHGKGTITMKVAGRMEAVMDEFNRKKKNEKKQ